MDRPNLPKATYDNMTKGPARLRPGSSGGGTDRLAYTHQQVFLNRLHNMDIHGYAHPLTPHYQKKRTGKAHQSSVAVFASRRCPRRDCLVFLKKPSAFNIILQTPYTVSGERCEQVIYYRWITQ